MRLLLTAAIVALAAHLPSVAFGQGAPGDPANPPPGQAPPTAGAPPTFAPSQPAQPDPWGGIINTHVVPISPGVPDSTFSVGDMGVMRYWENRIGKRDGIFCVVYANDRALCQYGTKTIKSVVRF